jgi:uracil-DNA glycosylase
LAGWSQIDLRVKLGLYVRVGGEYAGDWGRTLASALEWWHDAGVETLQQDEARDWLARVAAARSDAAAVASPVVETLPDTLSAFLAWRTGETAPEAGWMTPMIAPSGPTDAAITIVTDMPESEDESQLLGGAPGRLFDRMLAAIGHSRDSVHLVPLAWARPLTGQVPGADMPRLVELARHHLRLLQPQRLLLLGQASGHILKDGLDFINQSDPKVIAVASYAPRFLIERPAAKSESWKHLLQLTRGNE